MTREYVIQNLMNRYGEYGLTEDQLETVIKQTEDNLTYDAIHTSLRVMFSARYKADEQFSLKELITAFGTIEEGYF